jgi:hypothetical protein
MAESRRWSLFTRTIGRGCQRFLEQAFDEKVFLADTAEEAIACFFGRRIHVGARFGDLDGNSEKMGWRCLKTHTAWTKHDLA